MHTKEGIKLGLESGVDVTVYADKKFGEMQMKMKIARDIMRKK